MYRTWLYFVGMAVLVLLIFWLSEIVFFKAIYLRTKEESHDKAAETLIVGFNGAITPEYKTNVRSAATTNLLVVTLFSVRDGVAIGDAQSGDITLLLYQDPLDRQPSADDVVVIDENYIRLASSASDRLFSYRIRSTGIDSYTYVAGAKRQVGGETVYFYVASTIASTNTAMLPFKNQFIIITCISVIISVFLSFAFSIKLTRPITEFARTARLLGKGERVTFKGGGFEEYDRLAKVLNGAAEEIEKTEKMRRDFLANISHDLRTPLTMVKAYAEMIRDISGKNEEKRNEHCKVIIDEVDRLTLLVNDLLDLSKIQAGTRKPELKRVNLTTLVNTVMERFSMYAERDGYVFVMDVDDDCYIHADERMLEQICYNLIGNAVSYTGEDKRVFVRVKSSDGSVRVEISDTGRGIAPSEKDKVWERYYRASQGKRAVVGSGIGLSIVKSLLEAHGAEYGIESVVNNGTTFWFAFPLYTAPEEQSGEARTSSK